MTEVLDPRGEVEPSDVARPVYPTSLGGLRIGVIENTKHNAAQLIGGVVRGLAGDVGSVPGPLLRKDFSSVGAGPELLDQAVSQCDLVLAGTAD